VPPSAISQTVNTPGQVTGFFRGGWPGRGQSTGWRLQAPDPKEPLAWRSYPTGDGQVLPGSIGLPWFRSFVTEDAPSVRGGGLKPVHAGALAALPMWLAPSVRLPEPPLPEAQSGSGRTVHTATAVYRVYQENPPADWTAARMDPDHRGLPEPGQARPRLDRCVVPRPVRQTRTQQRSQRRSRDAS